jgi:Asp-tRNA(Asn)/Glu-tRNA(Gln) amidotransferase A subunit family amidase
MLQMTSVVEPCDLTAIEARRRIGDGRLTSVALVESCIARTLAVDHAVNAMVSPDFDRAREAARAADAAVARGDPLGVLHGLPVGVKDLQPVAGLRTTFGSPLFADHVPTDDCNVVARVRAAGGIVLGMTNTPEWGAGANTRNDVYGPTGNPFDPVRSAAGSSGGSAVALATGMVPIATGSDTGGSLRNPAAFCGVVGLRPTPGYVADDRRANGRSPLPVPGPMARTVEDVAMLLSVMVGEHPSDPLSPQPLRDLSPVTHADLSRLRVALSPDLRFAPTERAIADVFAEKTALFTGCFAGAIDAAPDCSGADEAFAVLRAVDFLAAHLNRYRAHPDQIGPNVRANVEEGLGYTAEDVAMALSTQTAMHRRWQAFFRDHDLLITPSITISPRPWTELYPTYIDGRPTRSYYHWLALAYAVTLVGHPAISLPVGLDHAGMPFGLQIVGPRGGEAKLLAAAAALERRLADDPRTARPVPDLHRLKAAPPIKETTGAEAIAINGGGR